MPSVKKNGKKKTEPESLPQLEGLPVAYPNMRCVPCWDGVLEIVTQDKNGDECIQQIKGVGPISREQAEVLLGWETEAQFTRKLMAMTPEERVEQDYKADVREEEAVFSEITLMDFNKERVVCHNNKLNRKFDRKVADEYCQSVLQKDWSGPGNFPGETVNGESLIIGRTGQVISGQHRLIGLVLAGQQWAKQQEHWAANGWETEPVLETMMVLGVSEHPSIVRTIDNVRARTEADVLYTSGYFRDEPSQHDRNRKCRMLAKAEKILWDRTAQGTIDQWQEIRTHAATLDFIERHPRLEKCCNAILKLEQKFGTLDKMDLTTYDCAAWLYLMGASMSDRQKYKDPDDGDVAVPDKSPSERFVNWSNWDKAQECWKSLANSDNPDEPMRVVREALGRLVDPEHGKQASLEEKAEIVCRGWLKFAADEPFEVEDIMIKEGEYIATESGKWKIVEPSSFGGIDIGPKKGKTIKDKEPEFSEEQKAAQQEEARRIRVENIRKEQEAKLAVQQPVSEPLHTNGKVNPNIDAVAEQAAKNTKGLAPGNAATAAKNATTKPRVILRGGTTSK
jgi:hypothetical protein